MKKIFPIFFLSLLFFSLVFNPIQAKDADWCKDVPLKDRTGGLVPCGRSCNDPTTLEDETLPCQLCHFFMMIDRCIDGLLLMVVPALAALMIAIGGFMYIVAYVNPSGGEPELLGQAKRLFTSVVIGLLIIYGAYVIIGVFLMTIGLADWTTRIYQSWWEKGIFEIPCP